MTWTRLLRLNRPLDKRPDPTRTDRSGRWLARLAIGSVLALVCPSVGYASSGAGYRDVLAAPRLVEAPAGEKAVGSTKHKTPSKDGTSGPAVDSPSGSTPGSGQPATSEATGLGPTVDTNANTILDPSLQADPGDTTDLDAGTTADDDVGEPSDAQAAAGDAQASPGAVWAQLVGQDLRVTLDDGSSVSARFVGQEGETVVFARREDGLVFAVPTRHVVRVYLDSAAEPTSKPAGPAPTSRGTGMIVTGSILTAAGSVALLMSGVTCWEIDCYTATFGFLAGGAAIGGGVALLVNGKRRRARYDAHRAANKLTMGAAIVPTRHGVRGGVVLRF